MVLTKSATFLASTLKPSLIKEVAFSIAPA
jgi:hypothetical protein